MCFYIFIFYFGCDRCLKEMVDMAEVSYGSRRSEWVIAWVTEIGNWSGLKWFMGMAEVGHGAGHGMGRGDRRSEWAEVGCGYG